MPDEIWLETRSAPGVFQVSSFGRIRSIDRFVNCPLNGSRLIGGRICNPSQAKNGYLVVESRNGGVRKTFYVHRLVAEVFCRMSDDNTEVNHLDGVKTNNHPANLEWCTHAENMHHAFSFGLVKTAMPVVASRRDGFGYWFPRLNSVAACGFQPGCVSNVVSGKRKSHAGFDWAADHGCLLPRPADSEYAKYREVQIA